MTDRFMTTLPTPKQLKTAQQKKVWDFGNAILYKLCKDNFKHNKDEKILAKVWLIGRAYSVALERRKNKKDDINDKFYTNTVAPTFRKSELDKHLNKLKKFKTLTKKNLQTVLEVHRSLTKLISEKKFTAQNKRSFSSKYLHFHFPNLFFIYDSRAVEAIRKFRKGRVPKYLQKFTTNNKADSDYAKFFCKCFDLKKQIKKQKKITLTNRQLDNLLIEVANKQSIKKKK
jgi:hypothetical protein